MQQSTLSLEIWCLYNRLHNVCLFSITFNKYSSKAFVWFSSWFFPHLDWMLECSVAVEVLIRTKTHLWPFIAKCWFIAAKILLLLSFWIWLSEIELKMSSLYLVVTLAAHLCNNPVIYVKLRSLWPEKGILLENNLKV